MEMSCCSVLILWCRSVWFSSGVWRRSNIRQWFLGVRRWCGVRWKPGIRQWAGVRQPITVQCSGIRSVVTGIWHWCSVWVGRRRRVSCDVWSWSFPSMDRVLIQNISASVAQWFRCWTWTGVEFCWHPYESWRWVVKSQWSQEGYPAVIALLHQWSPT